MTPSLAAAGLFCVCFKLALSQDLYEGDVCKSVRGGTAWTCKLVRDCPKAIQLLQSGREPQTCGYKGNEPIVCCEPGTSGTTRPTTKKPTSSFGTTSKKPDPVDVRQPTPTPQPPGATRKADQMCKRYSEYVYITISGWDLSGAGEEKIDTCDKLDALIVGGQAAKPREFPHMAQIGYGPNINNIKWRCGGSLISEKYVLSAAHCTDGLDPRWVRLGAYNNTKKTSTEASAVERPVIYKIQQRINHPDYKASNKENDIALYKLETDAVFDDYVRPACLQTERSVSNSFAVASGWGVTQFGGKSSAVLQKVNLTLTPDQECRGHYPAVYKPDSMFCAGDTFSNADSCQGDSGGPLQLQHKNLYCMYSILGITSFGEGCAIKPGVYTRVSNFVNWIESIVWPS